MLKNTPKKHKWIKEWMNEWMNDRTNEWTNEWMQNFIIGAALMVTMAQQTNISTKSKRHISKCKTGYCQCHKVACYTDQRPSESRRWPSFGSRYGQPVGACTECTFIWGLNPFCILYFLHFAVPMGISPMGNSGRFPEGKPAATESRYPTLINHKRACWVFSCFHNPPNSDMIINVRAWSFLRVGIHTGVG